MTERRPGQWPDPEPAEADEQGERHLALMKARAAFIVPMESIRAHLEEQPSSTAVRRAERQWKAQIGAAADQAVERLKRAG
ncbi:hypothetical protein [Streptomyces microflavus]|uniref:hypothetical protein n=1 Tax=Streptomyces microflavus TaxID=1919 RepID=UPI0033F08A47